MGVTSIGDRAGVGAARRRQLALAVVGCAVAAGAVLVAVSRTWLVEVTAQPEPLPAATTARSGGSLVPALPALGWVALAAAGALLATRGRTRVALGVLMGVVGLAVCVLAVGSTSLVVGVASAGTGTQVRDTGTGWRLLAVVAGAAVAVTGLLTVRSGHAWPTMGSRYERSRPRPGLAGPGGTDPQTAPPTSRPPAGAADLWDALDRGEDPTKG